MTWRKLIVVPGYLILAAVWGISAASKIVDLQSFSDVLISYRMVPPQLVTRVTLVVPLVELALAVAILVPALRLTGLVGTILLISAFTMVLAIAPYQSDCGCMSFVVEVSSRVAIWRNIALLIVTALLLYSEANQFRLTARNRSGDSIAV
jgi:hypothetical protein